MLGVLSLFLTLQGNAGAATTVVATVPVGVSPFGVGVNPNTNRIYVANINSNNVSVIDGATNSVIATVPAGSSAQGIGINPVTNKVYVSNKLSNSVSVIDANTNTVVATIPVGSNPWSARLGVNTATNRVYVANQFSGSVSVIDGATNSVVATIGGMVLPSAIAVSPDTNRVYVGGGNCCILGGGILYVIGGATNGIIATVAAGAGPHDIAVNPQTNRVYYAGGNENAITVIDRNTNAVVATIPLTNPRGISINEQLNRVYVVSGILQTVSVIDGNTNTVIDSVGIGPNPFGADFNPQTNSLYVTNTGSNNVSVINDAPVVVPLAVAIDIKPGSDPNCFNNNGNGVIPVAILGSASFDVTQIDAATVQLEGMAVRAVGKSNKLLAHIEDSNGDGINDLVVQIEDMDGVFEVGDTTATLTGALLDGTPIEGSDSICITQ